MELYCDGERVYLSRNYRVEGFSKKELLESSRYEVVWQSNKLSETPKILTSTRYHLLGAGGSKLFRMDRRSGESVELEAGNEIKDVASNLRNVFFLTAEGLYRVSAERFADAEVVRMPVSDLLDKPLRSLALAGKNLYILAGNFICRVSIDGELLFQRTLTDGLKVLPHYDGCVIIRKGELLYFTEDLEVLSSGSFEGEFVKAEHGAYHTLLLTDRNFGVYGKTGKRYAHVEDAHYISFAEGLNHVYFLDRDGTVSYSGKKDLLGDNFQEIDLTTLVAIIMASLMLVEKRGNNVLIKEEKGYIDVQIEGRVVSVEDIILALSKYFPEVFYLYRNPGYYEEIDAFAQKFDLFRVVGKDVRLNSELLERLIQMHSGFRAFEEDIVRSLLSL
ncbi:MAG: hypothetical protein WHS43_08005 [Aquificaceae bacterium]|uniref:hypothetical protein n=1 Tax=Hydrogenobacter sp. Uz 6-8 TaxID=3384828 RepID=UPI00309BA3F0